MEKQSELKDFQDKIMSDLFLDGNMFKKQNSNITWERLAKSLKKIASDPDSLYTGSLLTDFLNDVSCSYFYLSDNAKFLKFKAKYN